MKPFILATGLMLAAFLAHPHAEARDSVRVRGTVRKDGTYVEPHYRSSPDRSKENNYGSRPNVNPYTGQSGTRDPYTGNASRFRSAW